MKKQIISQKKVNNKHILHVVFSVILLLILFSKESIIELFDNQEMATNIFRIVYVIILIPMIILSYQRVKEYLKSE